MCGITGQIFFDHKKKIESSVLQRMTDSLARRGPDDGDIWLERHVGLGHRRLSIIDLAGSRQPMRSADGCYTIVFNGEIYNYKELRETLSSKGISFKTAGDTETILKMYEVYGVDAVTYLRGMFAFAIWDHKKGQLFVARDRIGVKPLHYYVDDSTLIFASEIKALLCNPDIPRRLNKEALHAYLSFLVVPAPLSMFDGIRKLLPGQWLMVKDGRVHIHTYWDVIYDGSTTDFPAKSEAEYCDDLINILTDSIRLRLVSDVPLGAFLSGGIDSSAVVALMSRLMDRPVKTFSIGFSEADFDESGDARLVAKHVGSDHTELILNPKDALSVIPDLIEYFDEPFADSSAIPTYFVSALARKEVKVVLSGDGGDELFGGYPWWHQRPAYQLHLKGYPKIVKKTGKFLASMCPPSVPGMHYLRNWNQPYERFLLEAKAVIGIQERNTLYTQDFSEEIKDFDPYGSHIAMMDRVAGDDWIAKLSYHDLKMYLPNDILPKVDMMSMMCSLEAREPLLDQDLVKFAARIPSTLKIKNGISKYIFKKALEPYLPSEVLYKKKQGFSIPLAVWLRGTLREYVVDVLRSPKIKEQGIFYGPYIEQMLKEFMSGNSRMNHKIWEIFVLEAWLQRHFP